MFKNLANMASVMRQAQQLGGKVQEVNDRLREQRVTGSAGGGLVEVEVNGLGEVLRLRVAPQLLDGADGDLIESLAPAAINQALEKAKQTQSEAMQSLMGNVNLPGLQDMFSQWTGSPPSGGPDTPSST
jgi:nucleoid-associated protein EbfC